MDAGRVAARERWARRAVALVGATMAYNLVEAGVALWAGVAAGSIALVGFGLDSLIEIAAGAAVLLRVRLDVRDVEAARVERAERRVHRFVGGTFFALAAYVVFEAGASVLRAEPPEESVVGIVLATASLIIMPLIAWGKFRAAGFVESRALAAEAKETLACSYLSFCLLAGLAAHALWGWWWADPTAALLMVPWLVREGLEGFEEG